MQKTKNLIWFTTNLRTSDNELLLKAIQTAEILYAIYVIDDIELQATPYGFKKMEVYRAQFLLESLADLKQQLAELNIPLFVNIGKPSEVISEFVQKHQIETVFVQQEFTQQETQHIQAVEQLIKPQKVVQEYGQFLWHPNDMPYKTWQEVPEIFTQFRKQGEKLIAVRPLSAAPKPLAASNFIEVTNLPNLSSLGYQPFQKHLNSAFPWQGGSLQAHQRIQHYFWETQHLSQYKETRNGLLGIDYSSKLSAWLALGCISAKEIYWQIQDYEAKIESNDSTYWLFFELIWRDYFKYIALKHQNKIFYLSGILEKHYHWNNHPKAFNDWTMGNTREPFVNANMNELRLTGWMSNRGRQNVASFWAKEWQQDWRIGAAYFESYLIDYDVHSNYGNWLYQSGVGNDPRDRKFNIAKQASQFDPQNLYINLWT